MRSRRLHLAVFIGLVISVISGLAAARIIGTRRLNTTLAQTKKELNSGHATSARRQLLILAAQWPGNDEVQYQLGLSEQACGRPDAAAEAYARVSPESELAGQAEIKRATIEMRRGRFSQAEDLMRRVLSRGGEEAVEATWGLVLLYRFQGRFDEARRVLREAFRKMPDKVGVLVGLHKIDTEAEPITALQKYLDNAGKSTPDDDRVWLGQATLALRSGRLVDADRWLSACQKKRPEDAAVWRQRLEWAIVSNNVSAAREAIAHIPVESQDDESTITEALALRAWLAGHQGRRTEERHALEQLVKLSPADVTALDKLAELTAAAGEAKQADDYRRREKEIAVAKETYKNLLSTKTPLNHAAELSRLCKTLGRRFEAEAWQSLANGNASSASIPGSNPTSSHEQGKTDSLESLRGASTKVLADLLPEFAALPSSNQPEKSTQLTSASGFPIFVDDASSSGLDFIQENGQAAGKPLPPVTMSGGVGLLDYDGDGWMDVYLVQGGSFPPAKSKTGSGDRLFRNLGSGKFQDATQAAGINDLPQGYGHGVTVGDYDADGRPDLFLTRWGSYALYRNTGTGRFEDVTEKAGFAGNRDWPTSAAFADLDNDGDLDLYVCHYFDWDPNNPNSCRSSNSEDDGYCNPRDFKSLPDHIFRNDAGRFVDVTLEAGFVDPDGRGLGVIAADLDDDSKIDVYVANDMSANYQFHNLGGFRFEEVAFSSGSATNGSGGAQAGMGVACGDLDGDGLPDLAVTNFYNESTTFFQNIGHGIFADHTREVGLAAPSRYLLGFGIAMTDVNNDARLDILTANGHIFDRRPRYPYMMKAQLLVGRSGGRLDDVTALAGAPFQAEHLGRGLAAGDLDNDGRIDLLMVAQNESVVYFHNESSVGHFLTLLLEGRKSNRDGVGAKVIVTGKGQRQVAQRCGGGSYQSASDPRLHFGLGNTTHVELIEVRWPSGQVDRFKDLTADTAYLLREGENNVTTLKGWGAATETEAPK